MTLRVEFYGIVRQRAGVGQVVLQLNGGKATLGDAMSRLAKQFPALAGECIDGNRLRPAYAANLGGERFVSEPATELQDGDCLLLLSADAGG